MRRIRKTKRSDPPVHVLLVKDEETTFSSLDTTTVETPTTEATFSSLDTTTVETTVPAVEVENDNKVTEALADVDAQSETDVDIEPEIVEILPVEKKNIVPIEKKTVKEIQPVAAKRQMKKSRATAAKKGEEEATTENVIKLLIEAKEAVPDRRKVVQIHDRIQDLVNRGADVSHFKYDLERSFAYANLIREDQRKKIAIVCYKTAAIGRWDPDHPAGAGSEEAVIFASQVLAQKYHVTVFGDPIAGSRFSTLLSNPRYVSEEITSRRQEFDVIILWRHSPDLGSALKDEGKVCLWLHDVWSYKFNIQPDTVFFLSEFHRKNYLRNQANWHGSKVKHIVAGNGLDYDPPTNVQRKPLSCVYASNYARGLIHLLRMWPTVRAKFPEATLEVAYGRQTWGNLNNEQLGEIVELLKLPGITEHGKLNYADLNALMQRCSFWTYPYSGLSETFCITAIRAQRCGLIPVTTREAALNETVYAGAFCLDKFDYDAYLKLLLDSLGREAEVDREIFVEFSKKYTWSNIVEKWEKAF